MENAPVVGVVGTQPASSERENWPAGQLPPDAPAARFTPGDEPERADPGRWPTGPEIEVRAARPGDLAALRRLSILHRLDQPEAQLVPYSSLRTGVVALVPGLRGQRPFLVACALGQLVGFAQFQTLRPDQRWQLVAVGARPGIDVRLVWDALLAQGVKNAGLRGVKRLYARAPQSSPVTPVLRGLGWAPYAAETVYARQITARPSSDPAGPPLRPQEPADTWAIHQLYNAAVPRQVQYAEAFTSHRWDARSRRGAPDGSTAAGWLVEEGHHVVGYVRAVSRGGIHVLELVYHPERPEVVGALIDGVLAHVPAPITCVYCAVRGYQAEAETALRARGFAAVLEQELHIKYTTANVRLPSLEVVPFRVDVRDKLPQRVPSFLHGQPRDESAT